MVRTNFCLSGVFYDALAGNERQEDEVHTPSPIEMDEMVNAEHHKSAQKPIAYSKISNLVTVLRSWSV